jgi:hypothetical protein
MDKQTLPKSDSTHYAQFDAGRSATASSSIVQEALKEMSNLSKGNQRPCTESELSPTGTGTFNCKVPEGYKHRLPPRDGYQTPDGVWHDKDQVQAKPEKQSSQNPSDTQNFDRTKDSPRTSRDLSPEELKSLHDRLEQGTLKSLAEKAAKDKIKEEAEKVCRQMGFGDCTLTYSDN